VCKSRALRRRHVGDAISAEASFENRPLYRACVRNFSHNAEVPMKCGFYACIVMRFYIIDAQNDRANREFFATRRATGDACSLCKKILRNERSKRRHQSVSNAKRTNRPAVIRVEHRPKRSRTTLAASTRA
jgi:hypothetical protein